MHDHPLGMLAVWGNTSCPIHPYLTHSPLPEAGGMSAVTVPVALGGGGGGTTGLLGQAKKEH